MEAIVTLKNCAGVIKYNRRSTMINDHLYEGRFTPRVNGKRISKNVYAETREECEEKLAELIKMMKAEIAEMKKVAKNA